MLGELMLHHHKQVLSTALLEPFQKKAEEAYHLMAETQLHKQISHQYKLPEGGTFVKQVSSFTLEAILGFEQSIAFLKAIVDLDFLQAYLPSVFYINVDQCWLRRQFPPGSPSFSPHGWHQDGALAFPFADPKADYEKGLLDMCVLWIPLSDGGIKAPGLEFIDFRQSKVRSLGELKDEKLHLEYDKTSFISPEFNVGDVFLFGGNMLHRTSSKANMKSIRTSLGIRIFEERPERCKEDRFFKICREIT
jgi:hypothetical protein